MLQLFLGDDVAGVMQHRRGPQLGLHVVCSRLVALRKEGTEEIVYMNTAAKQHVHTNFRLRQYVSIHLFLGLGWGLVRG